VDGTQVSGSLLSHAPGKLWEDDFFHKLWSCGGPPSDAIGAYFAISGLDGVPGA